MGRFKKKRTVESVVYFMVFYFGIDADTKECDDVLGAICFRAAFEMIEEFENYMVELIV